MIKPFNGHVLIEPVKHESFMASDKQTYQEIGVVVDIDDGAEFTVDKDLQVETSSTSIMVPKIRKGVKVLFDAWLAKKYPKEGSDDYYWLVRIDDIVAYEE